MEQKRSLICFTGLTVFAALLPSCRQGNKAAQTAGHPYNIVFIMSDDHAYQMIGCYDKRYMETPNIDRIANDGVKFDRSFVANSISGPSRACMLTGKHSHINGKLNNETAFDGNQQTMPKILHANGYTTAIFGKWHLESLPQGFDEWSIFPGQGDYYDSRFIFPGKHGEADTARIEGYVTDVVTDMGLDWLEKRDPQKPFALFIHHKAAHRNWMADTLDLNLFEEKEISIPNTFYDNYEGREAAAQQEMSIYKDMDPVYDLKMYLPGMETDGLGRAYSSNNDTEGIHGRLKPDIKAKFDSLYRPIAGVFYNKKLKGKELAEWKYQRYMKDYMKVIASLDRNIGKVLDYLEKNALLDNTLVVYTSDQGFYMGEHGWFDKRFMYEESMRTPLVMHLPEGLERRGTVDIMVQNIDLAPTFLDLAGITVPKDMQGVSLKPLLLNDKADKKWKRKGLYYHFFEYPAEHAVKRHYGIRTERYKLIHFYKDIDKWELFDLRKDPDELKNEYDNPKYRSVRDSLHQELFKLQEQYDTPQKDHIQ
ncbi:sulfatase [Porphyromonas macacae]|uniref:sulfatase family protein n=1 Tax=Porphyromonas macacae TaxID=28115 RepID=UPI00052B8826|nr:sulfatase [Porphyromonas macacae]KGN99954.1 sulfatase [Porphyromonas macacae]